MTAYEWVQGDHETVKTDLATLDGAPSDLDLSNRTVHYILRHYRGAKVADKQASKSGTTATVELTSENLSRTYAHEAEWVITGGADDPTSLPKDEPIDVDVRPSVDDDDNVAEPLPEDGTVDVLTANGLDGSITGGSLVESLVAANLAVDASDNLFVPDSEVASALDDQSISPQSTSTEELLVGTITGQEYDDPAGWSHNSFLGNIERLEQRFFHDGVWTWFNQPRAVYNPNSHTTLVGSVNWNGNILISQFDHQDGSTTVTTLDPAFDADDHSNPAIHVRPDGHILCAWSAHNDSALRHAISDSPYDASSFGSVQTTATDGGSCSYTQLAHLADEGRLYRFFRDEKSSERTISLFTSDDGGQTWSSQTDIVSSAFKGIYWRLGTNGTDRIDLGLTHAEGPEDGPKIDIRHVYIQDGSVYTSDGTELATLSDSEPLIDYADATVVYDTAATGNDSWIWDCTTTNGRPQVVYAELVSSTNHNWRYGTWDEDAAQWIDSPLANAGQYIVSDDSQEGYYSAGAALDEQQHGLVYYAAGDNDGSAIVRAQTTDNGESWHRAHLTDRGQQNIRPAVPYSPEASGPHPDVPTVWLRGRYDGYKGGQSSSFHAVPVTSDQDIIQDERTGLAVETFAGGPPSLRNYTGSVNQFSVSQLNGPRYGRWSLLSGDFDVIVSEGLSPTPTAGDEFRVPITVADTVGGPRIAQIGYFAQDINNFYLAEVGSNNLKLVKRSSGSFAELDSSSADNYRNRPTELGVQTTTGGDHTLTLYDQNGNSLSSLMHNDTEFSDGQIAWRGKGTVYHGMWIV